jgi:uncharacterized protein (DUF1778 family)
MSGHRARSVDHNHRCIDPCMAVQSPYMVAPTRSSRIEVRTTPADRALIDRAVAASGTDLTTFVVTNLTDAAARVLADRSEFALSPKAWKAWEAVNARPARDLPGVQTLLDRPSPFEE